MRGEIITIEMDGSMSRRPTATSENLPALNEAVGGMIGSVPRFTSFDGRQCRAYVNHDGSSLCLSENRAATRLWWDQLRQGGGEVVEGSRLHGPVVIVTGDAEFMDAVQSEEF